MPTPRRGLSRNSGRLNLCRCRKEYAAKWSGMSPGTEVATWWLPLAGVPALILSALLTGWLRRYALQMQILDHPNERSSHVTATPRGGGAAIVVVTLAGFGIAAALGM